MVLKDTALLKTDPSTSTDRGDLLWQVSYHSKIHSIIFLYFKTHIVVGA